VSDLYAAMADDCPVAVQAGGVHQTSFTPSMGVKRGRGAASNRSGAAWPVAPAAPLTKSGCSSRRHR
jgi:hypothetical protein